LYDSSVLINVSIISANGPGRVISLTIIRIFLDLFLLVNVKAVGFRWGS